MDDKPITDLNEAPTASDPNKSEKPSRFIKRLFVYVTMFVAWATQMSLVHVHLTNSELARLVVEACNTYILTMGVAYVMGYSIDRSEILTKLGDSYKKTGGER